MPKSLSRIKDHQSGQIIIIALVFMAIVTAAVTSLVGYAGVQTRSHRQAVARVQGISIAEAGIERAIWKLNNTAGYTGETNTSYGGGIYNITITTAGNQKTIRANSFVPNSTNPRAKRSVQVTATLGATTVAFNYGVHIGEGGLEMINSSRVIGNAYSNGNIEGSNSARIQGSAVAAGGTGEVDGMQVDGNANAHFIEDSTVGGSTDSYSLTHSTVGGNVVATTISNCTIGGNATYDTKTACTIGGTQTTPNPVNFTDPSPLPLPISEAQIDAWEQEAEAGGIVGSQIYDSGSRSLGPKKINGDLLLSGTAELVVTGTLWVTGEVRLSNSAILRLDPSFGALSGLVLAGIDESSTDGYIEISNSAQALGSGTAGSYIMLLSQREGVAAQAIRTQNSASTTILYAGEGLIEINNSAALKEVTAYKLRITNNATVTYESGLANSQFSSGPGGGWEVLAGTWQLLQ